MKDHWLRDAEILNRAQHDDVGLFEIVSVVSVGNPGMRVDDVRDAALDAVQRLVRDGLIDVGVMTDAGFVERTHELQGLVEEVLMAYDGDLMGTWQYRLWVRTTPNGDRVAQQAAADPSILSPRPRPREHQTEEPSDQQGRAQAADDDDHRHLGG